MTGACCLGVGKSRIGDRRLGGLCAGSVRCLPHGGYSAFSGERAERNIKKMPGQRLETVKPPGVREGERFFIQVLRSASGIDGQLQACG